ncbi:MAG TPA: styrene monooxygenase/indole monooxygenase family protein [Candidatus Acidoferrum sp.]|jgi:flavin reductase (DIM6/NTAB) family NADH-FMN oxidoreductase RutF/flavin-dependent dehydrogenase
MKRIAIIGAGQSGLQLGLGLLGAGYEVTVVSDRSAEEIRAGRVMSSQCMFDWALQTERELKLNFWERECPRVEAISFAVPGANREKKIDWAARLDNYAQAVDQRIKIPRWMAEFEKNGGQLIIEEAQVEDVEKYERSHDLVVIATGKGNLGRLFEKDASRSPYEKPQRILALTYVKNMRPREDHSAVCFNLIPGVGEYFVFPALAETGPCEIMVFEGVPGGPMDCWADVKTPEQHLAKSKWIVDTFLPWEAERCADIELTDPQGILTGSLTPVVRRPVAWLPSGKKALGLGDAVVLNDPITGQGSNNAAKSADIYLKCIIEQEGRAADRGWMDETFDRYWTGYARWVAEWTNLLLNPPPHVLKILESAAKLPDVASAIVNAFDDPRSLFPWFMQASEAEVYLRRSWQAAAGQFDRRDYRRALGQFATGVTIVSARGRQGQRVGLTVNSFSSVSLDPPLVLWSLAKHSPSYADFAAASHFAVNILAADQHHLSRKFSTPVPDRFEGVDCTDEPAGCPSLNGATATFVCRLLREFDGGDHVIFLAEVEDYRWREGEPLVFHSGRYRVTTRHPDLTD